MEFRILGPLEVFENGQQIDFGGAKQRALLAILLLRANEVVSTDRLIDALWEEEAPETGRKALQVYVSQLRKVLGKERLQTKPPGYLLRVEQDELDLERFQRLAGEGKPKEALALWRGQPLPEFVYQRFVQAEIARLEELRLGCLEQRLETDLGQGRHAAVVGELEGLVREHPLRERLRGQLMLALYRSGRQAEALGAYQDARRALTDELGIEPGRSLRELERAILQQDPELDLDAGESTRHEPPVPPLSIPAAEPVARETRKTVTAVYIGIATSSEHGERLDPETLRRLTTRAFGDIEAAVELHGGTIETIAGEALTAVFGLPFVHEDDALRAVRAADESRRRLTALAEQLAGERATRLDVRIGVSTGEVVTGGAVGTRLRATGEPLTRSSQLGQAAEPGVTLLDEFTNRLVRDAVTSEPTVVDSVSAFRLLRLADDLARHVSRFVSPMVGRERERRRLEDAFEQALSDQSCQLFTILGSAGVGKSRLVREFLENVTDRAGVARGRCLPYGEGITYWPVLEAVKDVAGLEDTESPEETRLRLAELIDGDEEPDLVAQRVTEVIGVSEAAAVGVEESFVAVRQFFEALAAPRPLVVVFDDVHWGEATFLDLVEHIADWARGAAILLVCVARPELLDVRPGWGGGKLNATSVLLEPLSDEQCSRLIQNFVGEAELAEEVAARIKAAAEGNPLFVEEMLSMLIEDGFLTRENGRWAATRSLATVPVPPTIQALLAARLDQLEELERSVIELAAVEGKVFHEGSVAELSHAKPDSVVMSSLAALVRKELIRPDRPVFAGERAFRFRHLLIRDAAYESIPKEARSHLHERHAGWLETKIADRAVEYEEIIGYHLEQAFRYRAELGPTGESTRALGRRAAERLGAAGRRAFARSDAPAALNLVSRAVALLPPDDPLRVDLIPNVRVVQGMEDLSWADKVLTDAVEAAATSGDRRLAAQALVQRGLLRLFTAADVIAEDLIDVAKQAIAVFDELEDDLGLARGWRLIAQAHYLGGRAELSEQAAERALAHARRAADSFEEREIVEWLGIALVLGPTPASEAEQTCRRLLLEASGHPHLEVHLLGTLAYLAGIRGRGEEFSELMRHAEEMVDALSEWIWLVPVHFAWIALARTEPAAAERALRPDYERLKRLGEKSHFCSFASVLAQAVYNDGRYEQAEQLAHEAAQAARPNDVHTQIIWRGVVAKVLARRGEFEAAELLAREAVTLAETSDFLHSHTDALMDLAEVLSLGGRSEEAAMAVQDAIQLFDHKGNVIAAAQARARLEDL